MPWPTPRAKPGSRSVSERIRAVCREASRRAWIAEIRKDAQKEFELGDIDQSVLDDFMAQLDQETDWENLRYDM